MPFPSKEYIAWCIDHREELPEWVPLRVGDMFIDEEERVSVMTQALADMLNPPPIAHRPKDWYWLPRPDQLIEMLEDRGAANWEVCVDGPGYRCMTPMLIDDDIKYIVKFAPDPAIALGEALLEVMKGGQR